MSVSACLLPATTRTCCTYTLPLSQPACARVTTVQYTIKPLYLYSHGVQCNTPVGGAHNTAPYTDDMQLRDCGAQRASEYELHIGYTNAWPYTSRSLQLCHCHYSIIRSFLFRFPRSSRSFVHRVLFFSNNTTPSYTYTLVCRSCLTSS